MEQHLLRVADVGAKRAVARLTPRQPLRQPLTVLVSTSSSCCCCCCCCSSPSSASLLLLLAQPLLLLLPLHETRRAAAELRACRCHGCRGGGDARREGAQGGALLLGLGGLALPPPRQLARLAVEPLRHIGDPRTLTATPAARLLLLLLLLLLRLLIRAATCRGGVLRLEVRHPLARQLLGARRDGGTDDQSATSC